MIGEKVGPGRPPRSGRFQKGKSGNREGRPRAQPKPERSAFDILLDQPLRVVRDGIEQEEAWEFSIYRAAITGEKSARRQVLKWIEAREKARAKLQAQREDLSGEVRIAWEPALNVDEALLLLGIASIDASLGDGGAYRHLQLNPRAVQRALSRRHGGCRLTGEQIAEIKNDTCAPGTVRWPRGQER